MNNTINNSVRKEIPLKDGKIWLRDDGKLMWTDNSGFTYRIYQQGLLEKISEYLTNG